MKKIPKNKAPLLFKTKEDEIIKIAFYLQRHENGNLAADIMKEDAETKGFVYYNTLIVPLRKQVPDGHGYLNTFGMPHMQDFVTQNELGQIDDNRPAIDLVCPYCVFNIEKLKQYAIIDDYTKAKEKRKANED